MMEILITVFLIYVLYNEYHKRKIKNEKKEFAIPREFYENLKDALQYIDYTLEAVKQRHDNVHKVYARILEIRNQIVEMKNQFEKQQNKRTGRKKNVQEKISHDEKNHVSKKITEQEVKAQENFVFLEKLVEESDRDKVDFSFITHKEVKIDGMELKDEEKDVREKKSFVETLGSYIRKVLGIPEITLYRNSTVQDTEEPAIPVSVEEFEKRLNLKNSVIHPEKATGKNSEPDENTVEHTQHHAKEPVPEIKNEVEISKSLMETDARKIIIDEAKKLFQERKEKQEQIKFIKKLIEIGFDYEEIHEITNYSRAEINLIHKMVQKEK